MTPVSSRWTRSAPAPRPARSPRTRSASASSASKPRSRPSRATSSIRTSTPGTSTTTRRTSISRTSRRCCTSSKSDLALDRERGCREVRQPRSSGGRIRLVAQAGTLLVEMDGISKDFPGVHALKECRFDLRAAEVHALVGENGAGKSTLMKILAGVYRKDAGHVRLKGVDVDVATPRAAQQLGISIIHQELSLMPHLTVAQNIFIGSEPR